MVTRGMQQPLNQSVMASDEATPALVAAQGQPAMPVMAPPSTVAVAQQCATTMDTALQCYFDGCFNVGNRRCEWSNFCMRKQKTGGCRRRYCVLHKADIPPITHQGQKYVHVIEVHACINCDEARR